MESDSPSQLFKCCIFVPSIPAAKVMWTHMRVLTTIYYVGYGFVTVTNALHEQRFGLGGHMCAIYGDIIRGMYCVWNCHCIAGFTCEIPRLGPYGSDLEYGVRRLI